MQFIEHLDVIVRYGRDGTGPGWFVWAACYVGAEIVLATIAIASVRRERRPLSDIGLGLPGSRTWWVILAAVLSAAAIIVALRGLDVVTITGRPGADYGVLAARTTPQRVLVLLGSAVAVPLEEIIWRGFATTRLLGLGAPLWLAVTVPSLAFGYFHGGTLDTFAVSVAVVIAVIGLSVVFLRTRSLAWPILLHFAWNVAFLSLAPTPQ